MRFYGTPILGRAPDEIAAMGLIRTFQSARIFPGMTALENVLAGAHLHVRVAGVAADAVAARRRGARSAQLAHKADGAARARRVWRRSATPLRPTCRWAAQKLLEVVRALMAEPRLLLLDEPAAGLNDAETADLAELLRAVRDSGVTVMVVEHNMSLVMGVADEVIVLDAGSDRRARRAARDPEATRASSPPMSELPI